MKRKLLLFLLAALLLFFLWYKIPTTIDTVYSDAAVFYRSVPENSEPMRVSLQGKLHRNLFSANVFVGTLSFDGILYQTAPLEIPMNECVSLQYYRGSQLVTFGRMCFLGSIDRFAAALYNDNGSWDSESGKMIVRGTVSARQLENIHW